MPVTGIIHVKASVMASMRDKIYMVSVTVEKNSSLILNAKCQCVAGAGGKCNHVAGVLFALLEYRESICGTDPALTSLRSGICHQGRANSSQNLLNQVLSMINCYILVPG